MILAYDCSRQKQPLKYLKLNDVKDEEEALYEIGRFLEVNNLSEHYSLTYVDRKQEGITTFAYGGMEMYDILKRRFLRPDTAYYYKPLWSETKITVGESVSRNHIRECVSISHNIFIPIFFILIKDEFAFEDKYGDEYQNRPLTFKQKEERKRKDVQCLDFEHKPYGEYIRDYSEYFFRCPLRFRKNDKTAPLAKFTDNSFKIWWYDEVELYYKDVFKREVGDIKCHS